MSLFLRNYHFPLLLAALILLFAVLEPVSGQWLRFDRAAMDQGEWWRFLTAHWVHLSWPHALGNLGGLALFAYISGRQSSQWMMPGYCLFSCLMISAGLYFFAPDLNFYVGLSGVLHGLLLVGMVRSPYYTAPVRWGFVLIVVAKVIWEQTGFYDDQALSGYIGGRVETRAHLLGSLSAFCWLVAGLIRNRIKDKGHG